MPKERRTDPYFDEGMRGWILNYSRKNFWRVAHWYSDLDDLVQDGALCFAKCRARYVDQLGTLPADNPTKDQRRWMMSLVKTTFDRYIKHTVAQHMRGGCEVPISQFVRAGAEEPADPWEGIAPPVSEEASLLVLLRSLPTEMQDLLVVLAGDGAEAAEALGFRRTCLERRVLSSGAVRTVRRSRRPLRETTNQYYCRLLGLDPTKHDLAGKVRAFRAGLNT